MLLFLAFLFLLFFGEAEGVQFFFDDFVSVHLRTKNPRFEFEVGVFLYTRIQDGGYFFFDLFIAFGVNRIGQIDRPQQAELLVFVRPIARQFSQRFRVPAVFFWNSAKKGIPKGLFEFIDGRFFYHHVPLQPTLRVGLAHKKGLFAQRQIVFFGHVLPCALNDFFRTQIILGKDDGIEFNFLGREIEERILDLLNPQRQVFVAHTGDKERIGRDKGFAFRQTKIPLLIADGALSKIAQYGGKGNGLLGEAIPQLNMDVLPLENKRKTKKAKEGHFFHTSKVKNPLCSSVAVKLKLLL